jgi:hypothetical protein
MVFNATFNNVSVISSIQPGIRVMVFNATFNNISVISSIQAGMRVMVFIGLTIYLKYC